MKILIVGAFVKMGFADDREIDVNGVSIVPRDVRFLLMRKSSKKNFKFHRKGAKSAEWTFLYIYL